MPKNLGGRPSKFNERLAQRIMALAKKGFTDREIAEECGIALSTLKLWKGRHKGFSAALNASKNVANEMVEAALFQRAIGYSHPDTKIFVTEHGIHTETVTKHHPPSEDAAKFWLKNRAPKRWREKQEVEHSGKLTLDELVTGSFETPTKEEEK